MKPITRETTCCFTGHRDIPPDRSFDMILRLEEEMGRLVGLGVNHFISGGAWGFDLFAASEVLEWKRKGHPLWLTFALPCKNHDYYWTEDQKEMFYQEADLADQIVYVSKQYSPDCMKKRNFYMVDQSAYCLCALLRSKSGTGQTVRYAREQGIQIVSLF